MSSSSEFLVVFGYEVTNQLRNRPNHSIYSYTRGVLTRQYHIFTYMSSCQSRPTGPGRPGPRALRVQVGRVPTLEDSYPGYPMNVWNCHEQTLQGLPRLNNSVEGWHRRLRTIVGQDHPSIYVLLTDLMEEEQYAQTMRDILDDGGSPKKKKRR